MTDDLIEKLTDWGCDTPGALHRLLGDKNCYIKCVKLAAEELKNIGELSAAVARGDSKKAFELAHYHKGSLANLGLTPLLTPMSAATESFRGGSVEGVAPLMDEIRAQKQRLDSILAS